MAIISKEKRDKLKKELTHRYVVLMKKLNGRDLESNRDGAGRGSWQHPELLCSIDSLGLNLATSDFKSILQEINKIK